MGVVETMEDVVREVTMLRRILPLRPTSDEYVAASVAIARADNALAARLEDLVRHKRPEDVPQQGFRALLEMRELVLRMQVQEQKRPWNLIVEAEERHQIFDKLIQKLAANGAKLINGGSEVESCSSEGVNDPNGYLSTTTTTDEMTTIGSLNKLVPEASDNLDINKGASKFYDSLDLAGGGKTQQRVHPVASARSALPFRPDTSPATKIMLSTALTGENAYMLQEETKTLSTIDEDGQPVAECPAKLVAMIQTAIDKGSSTLDMSDMFTGVYIWIPESLGQLTSLTVLKMGGNKIVKLPDSLGDMSELTVLDLQSNQLTSLPESLGRLNKLKKLNVEKNHLEELPYTIGKLESLEELRADFNQLKGLPEAVGYLTNLRVLSVHLNNLKQLPTTMGYLTKLTELDVHFNQLESLPEAVCFLSNLKKLNISSNFHALRHLPYKLGHLQELVELDISYNSIQELPDSFVMLGKLEKLRMEGNPWRMPPFNITQQGKQAVFDYMQSAIKQKQEENLARKQRGVLAKAVYSCFGFVKRCCEQRDSDSDLNILA